MTMLPPGGQHATTTILVGGHESANGADLLPLLKTLPSALVSRPGRALHDAVVTELAAGGSVVAVLPMTWGRDPGMVADTAKTLRWLAGGAGAGRLTLCADFGTQDHLVAWLRRAAIETARDRPGAGLLLAAAAANPFDDADLHRVAHLVRAHGAGVPVEPACLSDAADLASAVQRARLLGSDEVIVVPAGFAQSAPPTALPAERVSFFGPLLSPQSIVDVVRRRTREARHDLTHGDDGIAAGLLADHGHGYAHPHAREGEVGHAHPHPQAPHSHSHPPTVAEPATTGRAAAARAEPRHREGRGPSPTEHLSSPH
ncbi:sirohydrochlorin chelatase [Nocardioides sp. cx-173]|uniref:sirohydrochlorin chelatase n=1 Tax=Nocardioides sp. cx-173 TaxID=2898796 RepID=UPI001E5E9AC7|nr:hypothetical protein [Nocardioides sp. cx-173]MCD4523956.1 hypothetical protein [Nocardioides sp. cx-173]UGB41359.1 hypothetical protein LQ940_18565 [Nocardioides sp. cx-173]